MLPRLRLCGKINKDAKGKKKGKLSIENEIDTINMTEFRDLVGRTECIQGLETLWKEKKKKKKKKANSKRKVSNKLNRI
jgi:hypothetical protein